MRPPAHFVVVVVSVLLLLCVRVRSDTHTVNRLHKGVGKSVTKLSLAEELVRCHFPPSPIPLFTFFFLAYLSPLSLALARACALSLFFLLCASVL